MTADKAIAAFFTSALTLFTLFFGVKIDIATWSGIIAAVSTALAPILVYIIPNRTA
jgi:hypothetical protein